MNTIALKLGVAVTTALLALLAGLYLSGVLTPMLLKVQPATSWYETWWSYYRVIDLPQVQPHAGKIKLATAIGFGVPLLGWLFLLVPLFRDRHKALHGDARFATAADLAKKDMFKPHVDGIVVGKFGGKLVRLPGQQFVILAAPTRSGKGVGIVIPNLLDYRESAVVLDIKQENFDLTSGWRASQGQAIYLFNPFAEDRRTHRWNPLTYVSDDPAFRISDLQSIAAMLYPDGADTQKFWVSQARNAFTAFALYLFEDRDDQRRSNAPEHTLQAPTLGALFRLSSGDGSDLKAHLHRLADKSFLSAHARTAFANLLSQADETFASIMGTFKEPLNAWINPVLDAATSDDDFDLNDVRRKRMTIYIGIQPNKLAEARLIVNLFFSQLINQNTRALPSTDQTLKHQCLLLMDEFTAIGKVEIIATAIAYMAGYNIRLLPIIQSIAQLDAVYGKDVSRTMITNHALQIVYAPREQADANDYSEMLGYTTVRKRNRSRSQGQHGTVTYSESEERRALMLPQELKAMGFDKEVFFYEGIPHPVICEKIKFFKESHFTSRLMPKVEVPVLQIERPKTALPIPPEDAPAAAAPAPTHDDRIDQESDEMKLSQIAATAVLTAGALTACDIPQTKPEFKRNPNPQERYEITVTIKDAPGPFTDILGSMQYWVPDDSCMPESQPSGIRKNPKEWIRYPIERVAENTYRAEVWTDGMVDEDYHGLGVCKWTLVQTTTRFRGKTVSFTPDLTLQELRAQQPKTLYFSNRTYLSTELEGFPDSGETSPSGFGVEVQDELFTITLTPQRIAP